MNSKESKGFSDFQKLVSEVTLNFKRIAISSIELEKRLRDLQAERLADMVRSLQDKEKVKLWLTTEFQLKLKQKEAVDLLENRPKLEEEVANIKQRYVILTI